MFNINEDEVYEMFHNGMTTILENFESIKKRMKTTSAVVCALKHWDSG